MSNNESEQKGDQVLAGLRKQENKALCGREKKTKSNQDKTKQNNAEKEIKERLEQLRRIIEKLQNNESLKEEQDYIKKFLVNVCALLTTRDQLLKKTKMEPEEGVEDDIGEMLKQLIRIAVGMSANGNANDLQIALEMIHYLLNSKLPFYKRHGNNWVCLFLLSLLELCIDCALEWGLLSFSLAQQRGTHLSADDVLFFQSFRQSIAENTPLDYLHQFRWKTGIVREVRHEKEKDESMTVLAIFNELYNKIDLCKFGGENDYNFAPAGTQIVKYHPFLSKWRKELAPDSLCDALDSFYNWYTCRILQNDSLHNRVYVAFDEWKSSYNEWIDKFCVVFIFIFFVLKKMDEDKHKSYAKGGRTSGGVYCQLHELDIKIDDDNDPVDQNTFAVFRGELGQVSFHLVAVLNEFGRSGGFDLLTLPQTRSVPVRSYLLALSSLATCSNALTRRVYEDVVSKVLKWLNEFDMSNLSNDMTPHAVEAIRQLLQRQKSADEITQITEIFQLTLALRRILSQSTQSASGAQYIAYVCLHVRRSTTFQALRFISVDFLVKWIEDNKLLEILLGQHSQHYLIPPATDIVRFFCTEHILTTEIIAIIWDALERALVDPNDMQLDALCTMMTDLSYYLHTKHLKYLLNRLEGLSLRHATHRHIQLVKTCIQMVRRPTDVDVLASKILALLLSLMKDENALDSTLVGMTWALWRE
ncbi:hypothetical protein RFI_16669, partial [Reticulomyxa filosa]